MPMMSTEWVCEVHDAILKTTSGFKGNVDTNRLNSALSRIDQRMAYDNLSDVFDVAALYAVSIAKAHAFADGNKRTALVTMLVFLDMHGIEVPPGHGLDDLMVTVAASEVCEGRLSEIMRTLSGYTNSNILPA